MTSSFRTLLFFRSQRAGVSRTRGSFFLENPRDRTKRHWLVMRTFSSSSFLRLFFFFRSQKRRTPCHRVRRPAGRLIGRVACHAVFRNRHRRTIAVRRKSRALCCVFLYILTLWFRRTNVQTLKYALSKPLPSGKQRKKWYCERVTRIIITVIFFSALLARRRPDCGSFTAVTLSCLTLPIVYTTRDQWKYTHHTHNVRDSK